MPTPIVQEVPVARTSSLAVASLILAVVAFFLPLLGALIAIAAVICGHVAASKIGRSRGALSGRGLAIAGFVVGYVVIAFQFLFLPAMLLPAVANARMQAQGTRIASNGREIWKGLTAAGLERQITTMAPIWPQSAEYGDRSSTDYIRDCMAKDWLPGFDFSFFAGPGVDEVVGTDSEAFGSANNAWCFALDLSDEASAFTPCLFTRNFKASGNTLDTVDGLDPDAKPFGDRLGIVVTYGGAIKILRRQQATQAAFNPDGAQNAFIRN